MMTKGISFRAPPAGPAAGNPAAAAGRAPATGELTTGSQARRLPIQANLRDTHAARARLGSLPTEIVHEIAQNLPKKGMELTRVSRGLASRFDRAKLKYELRTKPLLERAVEISALPDLGEREHEWMQLLSAVRSLNPPATDDEYLVLVSAFTSHAMSETDNGARMRSSERMLDFIEATGGFEHEDVEPIIARLGSVNFTSELIACAQWITCGAALQEKRDAFMEILDVLRDGPEAVPVDARDVVRVLKALEDVLAVEGEAGPGMAGTREALGEFRRSRPSGPLPENPAPSSRFGRNGSIPG